MKSLELEPNIENVYETYIKNTIGRTPDVCEFVRLLNCIDGAFSIGIDGKWGTGKTFFIKQTKMLLDASNPNVSSLNDERVVAVKDSFCKISRSDCQDIQPIVTVYYDAWQHDDETDPLLSLMYEIMKDNCNVENVDNTRKWQMILASIAEVLSNRNIGDLVKNIEGKDLFGQQKDSEKLRNTISDFLKSFLPERGNRLVVFIDELDRCMPTYAVRLLERIKHYFAFDYITFVFAVNFEELQHTVNSFYGDQFDACRYMDRFFDIRMELPPVDEQKYAALLGLNGSKNLRETVCMEIIKQMNLSMREASKFLLMSKAAAYKYTDGDAYRASALSHDNGLSKLIGLSVIVPISLGLKVTNSSEYDDFISGKNSSWLVKIANAEILDDWVTNFLLSENESYKQVDGKTLVSAKSKLEELYKTVFSTSYNDFEENQYKIGKTIWDRNVKNSITKALGFVSPYTGHFLDDYE